MKNVIDAKRYEKNVGFIFKYLQKESEYRRQQLPTLNQLYKQENIRYFSY